MKKTVLATAILASISYQSSVHAQTDQERIQQLEQELLALKEAYIEGAPQRIKKIADRVEEKKEEKLETREEWAKNVEFGALIEVEASYHSPYEGDSESDIVVATFAPYITAQVNDWVSVEGALLYEEDDTDLEVDVATFTVANSEKSPFYSIVGQTYMPFGVYETNMVSDPLTLEIGETRETAIQLGAATGGLNANVYVFNGDVDKDDKEQVNSAGASISYDTEFENGGFGISVGYTNNLGDSDGLQEGISASDRVAGATASAVVGFSGFNLIGEYMTALDDFDAADYAFEGEGARPSAYNLEAGYGFSTGGKDSVIAVGYQGTEEALALELPKQRVLAAYRVDVLSNTTLAFEYAYDKDYSLDEGGTDKNGSTFTAQASVVF